MKKKCILWILLSVLVFIAANVLLDLFGFWLTPVDLIASLVTLVFWASILCIHIAMGWFIWKDAETRKNLLVNTPAWVWGLVGVAGGILGLFAYWVANCCKMIQKQTIHSTQPNPSPPKADGLQ
ncbi:MAG: hypothetical protein JJU29_17920 [Verrucomicrobia bacterium]|nr:hypothetical protein [Verrucomicrobiota bacterium]MCH8514467.1 hypothetical protein [Kiritimatiellia bacterium]